MKHKIWFGILGALLLVEIAIGGWGWREIRRSRKEGEARQELAIRAETHRGEQLRANIQGLKVAPPAKPVERPRDRFEQGLLRSPEFLKRLGLVQRDWIRDNYHDLFTRLALEPGELDRLVDLLAQKQLAKSDAERASMEVGFYGTGNVLEAIGAAQEDANSEIRKSLGDARYQLYLDYEMQSGLRTSVSRLQDRLSYSASPLSDADAEALVQAMDKATPEGQRGFPSGNTGASAEIASGVASQKFSAPFPSSALDVAGHYLNSDQIAALSNLIKDQNDELLLRSKELELSGHE